MAKTERKRTMISVDPEVHEVFVGMAAAGGMSVSRCMGEWLADTVDGAMFVRDKMIAARAAPMEVMREMQAMSKGLQDTVDDTMNMMRAGSATSRAAQATAGRAAGAKRRPIASEQETPRLVIRGEKPSVPPLPPSTDRKPTGRKK